MSTIIRDLLSEDGYRPTKTRTILAKSDFVSIDYSDGGEVENKLFNTLKQTKDVSVLSTELMASCTDWVSTYHFSHNRANLLRPFKESLLGRVLELGAGCGAITRYLGEIAQEVVAVEGSLRRCEINAERVRDLGNVSIVASELSDFSTQLKFDAVVVVGVLEYSGLFIDSPEPHLTFLRKAAQLLKPGGVLLLAIENKFGLKYFAGAPEDHTSEPMFGIEGRYTDKGVKTFSQDELQSLMNKAGFLSVYSHSPLPDYKMVRGLVSADGLADKLFRSGELASQLSNTDPQIPRDTNFSLRMSWVEVGQGSLDSQLANSFLIEARFESESQSSLAGRLAFWYGGDRDPNLLKEKTFLKHNSYGAIAIEEKKLEPQGTPRKTVSDFSQITTDEMEYYGGAVCAEDFYRYLGQSTWSIEGFTEKVRVFLENCGEWANENGLEWPEKGKLSGTVDKSLVDLTPRNVKMGKNGEFKPFDLEWTYVENIDLSYLVFRICKDLISTARISNPWTGAPKGVLVGETIWSCLDNLGVSTQQMDQAIDLEEQLQKFVLPHSSDSPSLRAALNLPLLFQTTNQELQTTNQELLSSTSWKITKPLRLFSGLLKKSN